MTDLTNIHVLVIEDNKDAAWTLKKMIECESTGETTFTVETAQDIVIAATALKSGRVDVVLLDLHLPNAPSGAELVKLVLAIEPDIYCIAITGWSDDALKQDVLEAGAKDFVTKPASPSELARKLMTQVIYRRSDKAKHKIDELLERLGPAMEAVARSGNDSGAHKFPPIKPENKP